MPERKMLLIGAGFILLAAVAVMGWTRKSEPSSTLPTATESGAISGAPATYDANGQPVYGAAAPGQDQYPPGRYVGSINPPVIVRQQPVPPPEASEPPPDQTYADRARDDRYSHPGYAEPERETRHGRSTKKSAEIVGGSAAAGAAIGALAGGGKGAGIGALSGGAAGFIYDRLTHNK